MRILIADDSKTIRMWLGSLLKQLGESDLIEVENGQLACDRVAQGDIQLIFLDLHMPVLDGLPTLRKLKSLPQTAAVPVLIISAGGDMRIIEEAQELGALGYIPKPFTLDGLKKGLAIVQTRGA